MSLDLKAKNIQEQHDLYGLYDMLAYGHTKTASGARASIASISDSCFHTGQALASECMRLQYALSQNDDIEAGKAKYLGYLGDVKEMYVSALSSDKYIQHWAWPQSLIYEEGSWFGAESTIYDDHVGFLLPYYIGKINNWK